MYTNYLKIALRNLLRNKVNATINLAGLAIGLACTILILLWIRRELSVDQFHADIDRMYRILENQTYSARDIFTVAATPGPMTPALKDAFPEIEHAARLTWGDRRLLANGERSFLENGYFADPDFFRIFSYPLVAGETGSLDRPRTVALSRKVSQKLFGADNAVGKSISVDDTTNYEVIAVFEDIPESSTMKFDFIMPFEDYLENNGSWLENWNSNGILAYLKLSPGVSGTGFEKKIRDFVAKHSDQENVELMLQPYGDVYLRTDFHNGKYQGGGRITYVRLFALIAAFILLIACINFMNLTTAYSTRRAREVGIRRVSGATQDRLFVQFLTESMLLTFISGILALGLVQLALPWFNRLFEIGLRLSLLDSGMVFGLLGLLVLTGFIAGSYPAVFLARFQPVRVLKGVVRTGAGAIWFRKGMVVTQFAIATFLILSTLIVYRQMQFLRQRNLGYNKENLLYINMMGKMWDKYDVIRDELLRTPGVEHVSSTNGQIFSWGNNTSDFEWTGKSPEENILFQNITVGYDFLATIGATLADGRDFSRQFPADSSNFVVNERAAELMGLQNPVGQPLSHGGAKGTIIGLVKDFNVTSLHNLQDPVILELRPWKNYIYVRIKSDDVAMTMAKMESVVRRHNPAYPFEYSFVDQEYNKLYQSEQRTSSLAKVFAFLSVFVSCLGLFGLAIFSTQQRTKEIGVRKVLGASVMQLSSLLSREFLVLVLAGFAVGGPVAWYLTHQWLEGFAYRTGIAWWLFGLAAGLALLIAYLTVSFHTIRAASTNPVKALRYE